MNVTLEKLNDTTGKLVVAVEENDYTQKVNDELKHLRRDANIPGFRKGTVPMGIIEKRFRKQVTSDVINQEVYEAVVKHISDNKIDILGEPIPANVTELDLDAQKDFTFEYELGFAPQFEVNLDKNVTLPYYRIEVTDEMLAEQDKNLTSRYGSQEPLEEYADRAILKGDIKELGKEEGAIAAENVVLGPWTFKNKEQEEKFNGAKVGSVITFNPAAATDNNQAELAAMLNVERSAVEDLTSDFEFTVKEISGLKPAEHGEEFFKQAFGSECTTEEKYNEALKNMIATQLLPNSAALFERQTRKHLLDTLGNFELPTEFLKKWLVRRNAELTAENIDEEYTKAEPSIKWEIISGRIAQKLEVKVTEEDLVKYATHLSARQFAQYGMGNIDEAILKNYAESMLKEKENRRYIAEQVANANLFDAIGNAVTIDDKTISLDEFKALAEKA
jgi:trigger factor